MTTRRWRRSPPPLAAAPRCPLLVVGDLLEQSYRKEAVPRLNRFDRGKVLKRRLERAFPETPLKAALRLADDPEEPRSQNFLLVGVPPARRLGPLARLPARDREPGARPHAPADRGRRHGDPPGAGADAGGAPAAQLGGPDQPAAHRRLPPDRRRPGRAGSDPADAEPGGGCRAGRRRRRDPPGAQGHARLHDPARLSCGQQPRHRRARR